MTLKQAAVLHLPCEHLIVFWKYLKSLKSASTVQVKWLQTFKFSNNNSCIYIGLEKRQLFYFFSQKNIAKVY